MVKKHRVAEGDTLTAIARRYNCTVSDLQKANPNVIKDVDLIRVGWVLNIPTKDYNALGECVEKVLSKIESLPEFKELEKLL